MSFTLLFSMVEDLDANTKAELEKQGHYVHDSQTVECFITEPDWNKAFARGLEQMKQFDKLIHSVLIVQDE